MSTGKLQSSYPCHWKTIHIDSETVPCPTTAEDPLFSEKLWKVIGEIFWYWTFGVVLKSLYFILIENRSYPNGIKVIIHTFKVKHVINTLPDHCLISMHSFIQLDNLYYLLHGWCIILFTSQLLVWEMVDLISRNNEIVQSIIYLPNGPGHSQNSWIPQW